ncbi:MAG: FG-GAP-like repeat-containing protein [Acidobacteriota bacterium]|nr:FG-GAP-like repeat-containing protein [Acidobacteriota bacterium]
MNRQGAALFYFVVAALASLLAIQSPVDSHHDEGSIPRRSIGATMSRSARVVGLPAQASPANDHCANRTPLTVQDCPFSATVNMASATLQQGEPVPSCETEAPQTSVWYSFTNTTGSPMQVVLHAISSNGFFPVALAVYTGNQCNFAQLTEVACDEEGQVTFTAQPGVEYKIQLLSVACPDECDPIGQAAFSLFCGDPPPNDNCQTATVAGCNFTETQQTALATIQQSEPTSLSCDLGQVTIGRTIWYQYTNNASNAVQVTVSTVGSTFDTVMAVYKVTGPNMCFANLTLVGCDDESGGIGTSVLTFTAEPMTTYKIQVGSFCFEGCDLGILQFSLTCQLPPPCSISGPSLVCSASYPTSVGNYTGPSGPNLSYSWAISGNGMINGSTTNQSVNVSATGTGSFTLTVTVTDNGTELESTCQRTVITGVPPPCSITGPQSVCPQSNGHGYTAPTGNGLSYAWSISGNGQIAGPNNQQMVTVNAKAAGSFTLTLTVTNQAGCVSACNQIVTVADTTPPTVTFCPSDATIQCPATPIFGTPTFSDECDTNLTVTFADQNLPASCPVVSKVRRTWTASDDGGNTVQCSQTITVHDTAGPTVTAGNIAACYQSVAAAQAAAIAATTATDDCSVTKTASTVGACSATITVTATDGCGNNSSVQYTTRIDGTPPTLTKGTIATCYRTRAEAEAAALAATTASDNCLGVVSLTVASTGTCSATITVTGTDSCGNSASVQYGTRIDNTPPTLSCPPNRVVDAEPNKPGAKVLFNLTATDNCGSVPAMSCTPPSGSFFAVGTTTVTCTAADTCGNASTCTFQVTVGAPVNRANLAYIAFQATGPESANGLRCPDFDPVLNAYLCDRGLLVTDFAHDQVRVYRFGVKADRQPPSIPGQNPPGELIIKQVQAVPVGDGPSAIVVGDYNGDGKNDAAIANQLSDDLSILLGNGDSTFARARTVNGGDKPSALAAGDFNGDRRLDLAVTNFDANSMRILNGQGNGNFRLVRQLSVGAKPTGIATHDFNRDGKLDLAVSNFASNDVTVLHGEGNGQFRRIGSVLVDEGPMAIVAADLDEDSQIDVATVNFTTNVLTVLRADGRGGFQLRRSVGEGPVSLVAGRFLKQSAGVAVANLVSGEVSVRLSDQTGALSQLQRYLVATSVAAITTGDFDANGTLDLAVLDANELTIRVLLDDGAGRFRLAPGIAGPR